MNGKRDKGGNMSRKKEFTFNVKVKSGPRTPLRIETSWNCSGINKSMHIFGSEFSKDAIGHLIDVIVKGNIKSNPENKREWLRCYEEENE